MSDKLSRADHCSRPAVCKNGVIVVLLVLLSIATTGWVVTATRERPTPTVSGQAPEPAAPTPTPNPTPTPVVPPPAHPERASDTVEILVAGRDLPVGTVLTKSDDPLWTKLRVPKDQVSKGSVVDETQLINQRISKPLRAGEPFRSDVLVRGGTFTLPDGMDMVSLRFDVSGSNAFAAPGSKVNILATGRSGDKIYAFPLLVNVLVIAVDTIADNREGKRSEMTVSFAVTQKQALALALAKQRGCSLEILLRHPNSETDRDRNYDLDSVIKLLASDKKPGGATEPDKQNEQPGEERAPKREEVPPELAPAPRPAREDR
jgi:Flp pilus assembly protein CpaB